MKILFLAAANSIHSIRWVNSLANLGHEIHFVYLPDQGPSFHRIDESVIPHKLKYSGNKGYYFNVPMVRRLFRKIKPDVVNAHYASGYGTLARLSKLRPLLLSVWGSDVYDFPQKNLLTNKIVKANLNYANRIASTSNVMADRVRLLMKNPALPIEITPFGVNIASFVDHPINEEKSDIVIGTIKTLAPKYGISDLIKAVKIVRDNTDYQIRVEIYGQGPEEDTLQNLISNLDLKDTVQLKGYINNDEVPLTLSYFDIFCVTSTNNSESFGVAAVEAMAAKLPVVATDADGFTEVVVDGVTGIIVEKRNIEEIANAILKLILHPEIRYEMGEAGYCRVVDFYDWSKNVKDMEKIYHSMLGKGD